MIRLLDQSGPVPITESFHVSGHQMGVARVAIAAGASASAVVAFIQGHLGLSEERARQVYEAVRRCLLARAARLREVASCR